MGRKPSFGYLAGKALGALPFGSDFTALWTMASFAAPHRLADSSASIFFVISMAETMVSANFV